VAGESAGGTLPGDWQVEKRQSQSLAVTMLRGSDVRRWGWKLNGPSRLQVGAERDQNVLRGGWDVSTERRVEPGQIP
jgi:hypothetical protein